MIPFRPSIARRYALALLVSLGAPLPLPAGEVSGHKIDLAEASRSLELETALYLAFANNFDLRQAQLQVLRQTELVREAKGALLPALSASGGWSRVADSLVPKQNGQALSD